MRITRFERYRCIMKKLWCYDLLRQGQQNCEIGTKFFSVPNIFDSSSQTFFRYQIFPIPVPRLFSGTKFFRYRFRYFFTVPNFSDTGTETFFRYQFFPIPVPIPPKKWKIPDTGNSRYRYVELCYRINPDTDDIAKSLVKPSDFKFLNEENSDEYLSKYKLLKKSEQKPYSIKRFKPYK